MQELQKYADAFGTVWKSAELDVAVRPRQVNSGRDLEGLKRVGVTRPPFFFHARTGQNFRFRPA